MRQEIVLGIGGVHALNALGLDPEVFHMNEGHSAFLALERVRRIVSERKLDFYSALQVVAAANIFTTHTPVPAGNDSFPQEMMRKYFGDLAAEIGLPFDEFLSFGQTRTNTKDPFSMTILALRMSRHSNGVSKLHGEVSRGLWKDVWSRCATARSANHQRHQRHPHQDLDGAGVFRHLRQVSGRLGGKPNERGFLAPASSTFRMPFFGTHTRS